MAACGLANKKIFMIGGWHTDTGKTIGQNYRTKLSDIAIGKTK